MGEAYSLPSPTFNSAIKIESRPERLTSEAGALYLREIADRLEILPWLVARLKDPRDPARIVHPLSELLTTAVVLAAMGWRDQDDADTLRNDPALRVAVSGRRGTAPLEPSPDGDDEPRVPDGLASQPTLSRLVRMLSSAENRATLREGITVAAGRRIRAMNGAKHLPFATIDVDSLPIPVEGHQEGSEYNGHYGTTVYHPLVASLAETRDLLDVRLRHGTAHTAEGALEFILPLVSRVEREIAPVVSVRFDAGFPSEPVLVGLEERKRRVHYVARVRNNAALNRLAEPFVLKVRPCGDREEPKTHLHELSYQAGSWSRARRVVLVIQQRPGELFPHHFWLLTSWTEEQIGAADLLALYRRRGIAESLMGEWMSTLSPALSSTRRPKSHYREKAPKTTTGSGDPFAANEVILLLSGLAYQLLHTARTLVEEATQSGWSLKRVHERVLKVAARVVVHARRATFVIASMSAELWDLAWRWLGRLSPAT